MLFAMFRNRLKYSPWIYTNYITKHCMNFLFSNIEQVEDGDRSLRDRKYFDTSGKISLNYDT